MVGEQFQIGKKYTKNEILAIKGSSYIPTDHCYNRYCLGGAWSNEKPGQSVLFEYIQEYEDGQNITYFKYLGPNAQYSGPVLDFRKETKGEIFGNWDNGIFTKNTKILNGIEQQIINKYLELKANNVFQEYREELERSLNCIKDKYGFDFREKYNINTLTNTRGKDLLMYLFAPKDGDTIGLSRILEYDTKEWGLFNGFDYQKNPVAFCSLNGSLKEWRISNGNVVQEQVAVEIAEDVKNKIIELNQYIIAKDFDKFTEKFPIKNYRFYHKFFYMLYPEYLTSYHAKSFAQNIKEKLGINLSKELGLEKYFMNIIKQSGISGIKVDDLRITVEELLLKTKTNKEDKKMKINIPLNQILYGPPGTGKTYNTVISAMEIIGLKELFQNWYMETSNAQNKEKTFKDYCKAIEALDMNFKVAIFHILDKNIFEKLKLEITNSDYFVNECKHAVSSKGTSYYDSALNQYGKFLNCLTYEYLKNRFDELKQAGQIEFVTFHQSYSYEEFVEGIKPALENKDLSYKLEDGIFKQISSEALFASLDILEQDSQASFEFNHILEKFKELYPVGTAIKTEKSCFAIIDYLDTSIRVSPLESKHNYSVSYEPLEEMFKIHLDTPYSMPKDLADKFGSFKGLSTYYFNILEKLKEIHSEYSSKTSCIITEYTQEQKNLYIKKYHKKEIGIKNNVKPYILIIDEINRGDVSKIFGELITLIEEDKRIGNKYQMKTTLPYSKEPFGVPNNLYIIGTMNTADRSIALLDAALRRRFDFEEIMPRPELLAGKVVAGINLEQLLKRINERITDKYDRDHQIGHSYLMDVALENDTDEISKNKLERAYKNRILPLLNEYFYNDTKTVSQILNCSENELQNNFLDVLNKAQNS